MRANSLEDRTWSAGVRLRAAALAIGALCVAASAGMAAAAPVCAEPDGARGVALWWDPCPEPEEASEEGLALPLPVEGARMVFLPTPAGDGCAAEAAPAFLGKYELTVGQAAAILAGDPTTGAPGALAQGLQALADRLDDGEGRAKRASVEELLWRFRTLSFGVWNTPQDQIGQSVIQHLARPATGLTPAEFEELARRYTAWCYRSAECRQALRTRFGDSGAAPFLRLPNDSEWRRAAGAEAGAPAYLRDTLRAHANLGGLWSDREAPEAVIGVGRRAGPGGFYDLFGNVAELTLEPLDGAGARSARGGSFRTPPDAEQAMERREVALFGFDAETGMFLGDERSPSVGLRLAIGGGGPLDCAKPDIATRPESAEKPAVAPKVAAAPEGLDVPAEGDAAPDREISDLGEPAPENAAAAPPRRASTLSPKIVTASDLPPPGPAFDQPPSRAEIEKAMKGGAAPPAVDQRAGGVDTARLRAESQELRAEAQGLRAEMLASAAQLEARTQRLCGALAETMFLSARSQLGFWSQYYRYGGLIAEMREARPSDPEYYDVLIGKYEAQQARFERLAERYLKRYSRAADVIAEHGADCAAEGFAVFEAAAIEDADDAVMGTEAVDRAREHALQATRAGASEETWRRDFRERGRRMAGDAG